MGPLEQRLPIQGMPEIARLNAPHWRMAPWGGPVLVDTSVA
jgi:hypothetical protein